ncbi:glycosyl hydrolase family 5 [Polynucleobacter sp. Ross1-W9]|uniref:glycosyl hydrolase family 8 n=1 Tax=Polynucleobacter parvulilacunae TaxID=1855631 RepID=UPI001C0CC76D|nr:glycosyl hydrolase family 8 [Polynucleobacter parvulilacunae]MBU3557108.1 glycosyl hydrolase family 5 [Polynucleobacter parvulilacunae]
MAHITRTRFWLMSFLILLTQLGTALADTNWEQFKDVYIANGRVVDKGQDGISHSEGQGMALLLAVQNNDQKTFKQIWDWTKHNLQTRDDKLFAWSWSPNVGINDVNNASDGDLFIVWALSMAYTKWNEPSYLYEAIKISQSIRQKLLLKTNVGTVILPGAMGFEKPDGLKLNLSYWVFPAIAELSKLDPAPEWEDLRATGLWLIKEAQFGKWQLPPDWLKLEGDRLKPVDGDQFGYDAIRIPLYLIWGQQATPSSIKPFQKFWGSFTGKPLLPAWVNVNTGEMATYNASEGFYSVAAMTLAYPDLDSSQLPSFNPSQGYYSSMLSLFTKMTLQDLKK